MDSNTPYIFGIGVAKTGSHSLAAALTDLGFSAYHTGREKYHNNEAIWQRLIDNDKKKQNPIQGISGVDAIVDYPVWALFKQLDQHVENARFVMTYRPPSDCALSWCRMILHHHETAEKMIKSSWKENPYARFLEQTIKHIDSVFTHFHARPDDLLVLDMRDDDKTKWRLLANFLNVNPPENKDFPNVFNHKKW